MCGRLIIFLFTFFETKGMKDPLTKSEAFVTMLREHCSKVQIRELNAGTPQNPNVFTDFTFKCCIVHHYIFLFMVNITGHAPHDEVPDEVNTLLCEWTKQIEVKLALEKTKAI